MSTNNQVGNPTFTSTEATNHNLIDKKGYARTQRLWEISVAQGSGNGVEPTAAVLQKLVNSHSSEVQRQVEAQCKRRIDPLLKDSEDRVNQIRINRQSLQEEPSKVTSPESGIQYTEQQASDRVHDLDRDISRDENNGKRHHRRVNPTIRSLAKLLPYAEALGLALFVALALNVNFLDPLDNLMGWSLAAVLVFVVLFVQPRYVNRSAEAYNHYREAVADQQSFPAEAAAKRAWTNGAIAAGFATFITGALVERFLAINAVTDDLVVGLMICLCILAGFGMPIGAWLAIAWDGSRKSRERDHLAEQLDESLARDTGIRNGIAQLDEDIQADTVLVTENHSTAIFNHADDVLDDARCDYAFLRIQLGGLSEAPPYDTDNTPAKIGDDWKIHSRIPKTDSIHLKALEQRHRRLDAINEKRRTELATVAALPHHPWATQSY